MRMAIRSERGCCVRTLLGILKAANVVLLLAGFGILACASWMLGSWWHALDSHDAPAPGPPSSAPPEPWCAVSGLQGGL